MKFTHITSEAAIQSGKFFELNFSFNLNRQSIPPKELDNETIESFLKVFEEKIKSIESDERYFVEGKNIFGEYRITNVSAAIFMEGRKSIDYKNLPHYLDEKRNNHLGKDTFIVGCKFIVNNPIAVAKVFGDDLTINELKEAIEKHFKTELINFTEELYNCLQSKKDYSSIEKILKCVCYARNKNTFVNQLLT